MSLTVASALVNELDSEQTGDIEQFIQLDNERDYGRMLTLCTSGKYVRDFWHVLTGRDIKKWHLIEDDAKGVAKARAVRDAVFVS